jgi:hypothetical protein
MELTYKVRGADGKEYGPATLQQLSSWIREGRLPGEQEVQRSDMNYWVSARDYTELQPMYAAGIAAVSAGPAGPSAISAQRQTGSNPALAAQLRSGASWFYWVAGLSLLNSIISLTGSNWRFLFGLGLTQIFDALRASFGGAGTIVVLALDLAAAGVFVLFGVFASKRHLWAFIVGMVLFALDGVILLLAQDWLGVGFHVFVLYCLFRGLTACRQLKGS